MKSKRTTIGQARVTIGSNVLDRPVFRESLVINWAGVSAGYTQDGRVISVFQTPSLGAAAAGPNYIVQPLKIVIGRNLSYVGGFVDQGLGGLAASSIGNNATSARVVTGNTPATGGAPFTINVDDPNIEGPILDEAGEPYAFPTELILAPGQTFSAVCGVYNIVVIPENG